MSVRASIVSFVLRHTLKKQMATFEDPAVMRRHAGLPGGRVPADVTVEPVDAGGVAAEWVYPRAHAADVAMLYLHGGGYVFGGLDSHRDIAWRLARESGIRVLVLDYRLAPEHRFPAAVEDVTAGYRWLLEQGYAADRIVVAGDSAGGGLSMALMVNLKQLGVPGPNAAVLMSPWADLAMTGASMQANAAADVMLSPEAIGKFASLYLGDGDARAPLASPVFADLSGLPPTYVIVGSHEVLRSDSETLVERITAAGGKAELKVWPNMPHVFPVLSAIIPEGRQAIGEMSAFTRSSLGLGR
ncbi:MAG TPA: alpha/beta hydrolase [Pseudomonadales bacterium]